MQPIALDNVLPTKVNNILQYTGGAPNMQVIIIESYFQRGSQQTFWQLYTNIETLRKNDENDRLRIYRVLCSGDTNCIIPNALFH